MLYEPLGAVSPAVNEGMNLVSAIVWIVALVAAAGIWRSSKNLGSRRLIIAVTVVALVGTSAFTFYAWNTAERAATESQKRLAALREDAASAYGDAEVARLRSKFEQASREAGDALTAFYNGGYSRPRPVVQGPDGRAIAAEIALANARAAIPDAERIAATQVRGWSAVFPVLTSGGLVYLAALALLGGLLWVTAGFSTVPKESRTRPVKPVSRASPLSGLPIFRMGVGFRSPTTLLFVGLLVLFGATSLWLFGRPQPSILDGEAISALAEPSTTDMAKLSPESAPASVQKMDGEVAVKPKEAVVVKANASWLAGRWSVDGFCEGDAGETFLRNGEWGKWGTDGRWEIVGDNLRVTQITRVLDTESGNPEPIIPAEIKQGRMSDLDENEFVWMGEKLVRCLEG